MKIHDKQTVLADILHFFIITVVVYGLIGNILCFKIYSSSPLRKHSVSLFFRVIAIVDSIMLVDAFLIFMTQKYAFSLIRVHDIFCRFKDYFFYATGPITPWLMVVISIERFLSISYPKKFDFLFKRSFQIAIICIICVFNYLFYSFITWNSRLVVQGNPDKYFILIFILIIRQFIRFIKLIKRLASCKRDAITRSTC